MKNLDNFYVKQQNGYGIGNFINCTPTIAFLADYYASKIAVYFESNVIEKMYENCTFIRIIKSAEAEKMECLFSSSLINGLIPDWKYIYKRITKKLGLYNRSQLIPHTYVDAHKPLKEYRDDKYVVVVRGMVEPSNYWVKMKDPGDEIYKYIINKLKDNYKVVFIGNDSDNAYSIKKMKSWYGGDSVINDIKKSLALINNASLVISNDTGMYHAAGALNKKSFVLWKKTKLKKNLSPASTITISKQRNWKKDFDTWLNNV